MMQSLSLSLDKSTSAKTSIMQYSFEDTQGVILSFHKNGDAAFLFMTKAQAIQLADMLTDISMTIPDKWKGYEFSSTEVIRPEAREDD